MTNFSTTDLARMDSAIAQGVRKVKFTDGREVEYSTFKELVQRRNFIAQSIGQSTAQRSLRAQFSKGTSV